MLATSQRRCMINTIRCICIKILPDDGWLIYSKHGDNDYWNKLRDKSATFWSLLRKHITIHGPQNVKADQQQSRKPEDLIIQKTAVQIDIISNLKALLLLMLGLQPTIGFSLLGDFLPFRPFLTQFSPPSYSHRLNVFLNIFNPSFPWSSSDSPTHWLPF